MFVCLLAREVWHGMAQGTILFQFRCGSGSRGTDSLFIIYYSLFIPLYEFTTNQEAIGHVK